MTVVAPADLVDRRPVWAALSSLFLDTDVALDRAWRARQLSASPYTLDELDRILADEIYPVCRLNLWSVAGVWSGFDLDWLEQQVLRRRRARLARLWHGLGWRRIAVARLAEWQDTRRAVQALRADMAAASASPREPT